MQWLRGRRVPQEDRRRARLLQVLDAATAKTRYAREYPKALGNVEELPPVALMDFLCHTERYTVLGGKSTRERLFYPLGNPPRTAVVARAVEESRRVRCFSRLDSETLREFAPHALAAPLDALRAGIAYGVGPLRNAVIVFSGILEGPLLSEDADLLWHHYQVPVFQQFLGMNGELLAWECEMHHGLHVREEAAYFEQDEQDRLLVSFLANPRLPVLRLETGLAGSVVVESCPCGEATPRLVDVRRRAMRRAAVSAGSMTAAAVS